MKKSVLIFFTALLLQPYFLTGNEFKIVNGDKTTKEEWDERFSGVVMIMMETPEGLSSCTATLIDPEVLLTAHHCVGYQDYSGESVYYEPEKVSVYSGLWCGYTSLDLAAGKEIVVNEYADIALIHLDKKIPGHIIYPVRDEPAENIGDEGVAVGYGVTGTDERDSGTQRWGDTHILDIWQGDNILEVGNTTGLCFGDSGGPLFTTQDGKKVVSGVASFVSGGCSSENGSFSVQVVKYRDWIEETMFDFTGHDLDSICGDGDIDEGETCEVGDVKDCAEFGDYIPEIYAKCNADCNGYDISICEDQICGNFRKEGVEACDDGNGDDGDYCSSDCTEVTGECGDGTVQTNEECDDGNTVSGDGCDLVCKNECGNGIKEGSEACDDGNLLSGDGCDEKCRSECGNGELNVGEECDDGNLVPGDGCDEACVKEPEEDKETGCSVTIF